MSDDNSSSNFFGVSSNGYTPRFLPLRSPRINLQLDSFPPQQQQQQQQQQYQNSETTSTITSTTLVNQDFLFSMSNHSVQTTNQNSNMARPTAASSWTAEIPATDLVTGLPDFFRGGAPSNSITSDLLDDSRLPSLGLPSRSQSPRFQFNGRFESTGSALNPRATHHSVNSSGDMSPTENRVTVSADRRGASALDYYYYGSEFGREREPPFLSEAAEPHHSSSSLADAILLGGSFDAEEPGLKLFGNQKLGDSLSHRDTSRAIFGTLASPRSRQEGLNQSSSSSTALPSLTRLLGSTQGAAYRPSVKHHYRAGHRHSEQQDNQFRNSRLPYLDAVEHHPFEPFQPPDHSTSVRQSRPKDDPWDMPPPFQPPTVSPLSDNEQRRYCLSSSTTAESDQTRLNNSLSNHISSLPVTKGRHGDSSLNEPNGYSGFTNSNGTQTLNQSSLSHCNNHDTSSSYHSSNAAAVVVHQQQSTSSPSYNTVLSSHRYQFQPKPRSDDQTSAASASTLQENNSTPSMTSLPSGCSNLLKPLQRPEVPTGLSNVQARYERYVSIKVALEGLSSGAYHKGILRVSAGRPDEAYITNTSATSAPDYLIQNRVNRNRSIHGDTVVFEVLDKTQWVPVEDSFKMVQSITKQSSNEIIKSLSINDQRPKDRPTCRVVHVLEFGGKDRPYVSVLRPNRISNNNAQDSRRGSSRNDETNSSYRVAPQDKFVKAVPLDKRIPWILIPVENVQKFQPVPGVLLPNVAYRVQIEQWPETSSLPVGRIVDYIGNLEEFDTEQRVAMVDHGLEGHMEPFNRDVENEVSRITENALDDFTREVCKRLDLRQSDIRIMTIDPKTARDLDDAIHIRILDDSISGNGPAEFEIGVHIADVTHFVPTGSSIDTEARRRCTTVYLPNENFPMLPRALCDHLCSLNPNEDKLTFSVIFSIKSDGTLSTKVPPWIGRTVVKSCCRFHYGEVQNVLNEFHSVVAGTRDSNDVPQFPSMESLPHPEVHGGHQWREIWQDLVLLESVTQQIRQRRFERGSLLLHQSRLIANEDFLFSGNDFCDGGLIEDEEVDDSEETSHHLIEELMLIANKIVAEKMVNSAVGDYAVLRFHPSPLAANLQRLTEYFQSLGLSPNFSSAASTHQFLLSVRKQYGILAENATAQLFMQKMKPADYGVAKYLENTGHFALAFNLYTHFTSPIRRYADVMVHRVLTAALQLNSEKTGGDLNSVEYNLDLQALNDQCNLCNDIRLNAKNASEECAVAFFCVWLKERELLYPILGTVLNIQNQSVVIYLPKLGTCKRIFYNNVHLSSKQQEPHSNGSGKPNNSSSNEASILHQMPPKMLEQLELPLSIAVLNPHTIEIQWSRNEKTPQKSQRTVRQLVRSLCPIPVLVCTLNKIPVEFGIVALPPWDCRYKETITRSNLMTPKQKMEVVDSLEKGLQKGHVDLPGCRPPSYSGASTSPTTDILVSSVSSGPSNQVHSKGMTSDTGATAAVDVEAARRIFGFHTTQRGHYRERQRNNLTN